MPQITVTEQGGSGRYISFGDAAALRDVFNNPNGGTIILYVKPGNQTANDYTFCKCDSGGWGMRVVATTDEKIGFCPYKGAGSTDIDVATSIAFTQAAWQHWQVTFPGNGELTGSNAHFYRDSGAEDVKTYYASATAPISSDAGLNAFILNRPGLGRHFVGDLAYVAFWNRVLDSTERATVRSDGPLAVSSGLVFCFANGQDYGPNAIAVVDRTAQVAGSTPPNTNLGGEINLAGAATATASASGTLAGGDTSLAGSATAQASASATLGDITIFDTADRGTLDLVNCSITPNGSTPTISVRNMYAYEENAGGARNCFFHVTGVNGLRPVFDVDRSNMQLSGYTGKFKWSYTGERGSWNDFTTTTRETTPNVYRSQHADAFTQDTVYISMMNPWRVGYTLPWLQSLESSGFVTPAPSGGTSYQFETRSATVDYLGNAIAAQPLFSAKISNGAANAPDGNPKRKLVMMSGVHAPEDVGNYALKGAVEFLVSNDPLAVSARQWFDAYIYPIVASAGRAGGTQRGDFQAGSMTADVNRAWDDAPVLETVTKHKAAVLADVGATVHIFADFHGDHTTTANLSYFVAASGSDPYLVKWDAAIDSHLSVSVSAVGGTEEVDVWFNSAKGCHYSMTPECGYSGEWTPVSKEAFGAAHIKAIATLIAQGEWGQTALTGAALVVAGATGTLTTQIPLEGVAVANAGASGSMDLQVSLSGDALAQALSSALLSTGIVMTADAVSAAAAQGTLTTAIQMLGGAVSIAFASGDLSANTDLSAQALASAIAQGSLTTQIRLAAVGTAQAGAEATLSGGSAYTPLDRVRIVTGRGPRRPGYLYGDRHGIKIGA